MLTDFNFLNFTKALHVLTFTNKSVFIVNDKDNNIVDMPISLKGMIDFYSKIDQTKEIADHIVLLLRESFKLYIDDEVTVGTWKIKRIK